MEKEQMVGMLSEAIENGNVEMVEARQGEPHEHELLKDETGTSIILLKESRWSKEAFGIAFADGDWFTGVVLTPAKWAELKVKIDNFLEERNYNKT